MAVKKDNSTFRQKVLLRQLAIKELVEIGATPVVLETHGGYGKLYRACYRSVSQGIVLEKDRDRAAFLARQRPMWAVYEADCVDAVRGGVGAHLPVNLLDADRYGDPWPVIEAFFESERPRPGVMLVVVNDGLRQKVRMGGAWSVETLRPMVERYGNDLHPIYLEVCQVLIAEKAAHAGYTVDRFAGYYCGHAKQMTHYLAILHRGPGQV